MNKNIHVSKLCIGIMVLLFSLLLIGCDRQPPAPPNRPDPVVSTITVAAQKTILTTELPGRTTAYRIAHIRPQVSGLILKRVFTEGTEVNAGQILYQIDPAPYQAALEAASANLAAARKGADQAGAALEMGSAGVVRQQATLELARINAKRFKDLARANAVSVIQRDQAVTEAKVAEASLKAAEAQMGSYQEAVATARAVIQQAEAAVRTAQINLEYCRVVAPISGRIGRSDITEGAIVTAFQPVPLTSIQQLDPIYVDVPQATKELLRLKQHLAEGSLNQNTNNQDKVRLILEDGTPYPLEGTLQFSDVTVDPTTGSVILRIVFPNPDGVLLPGMFVRALVKEGVNENAILIPQQGVSRDHRGNPIALIVDTENHVGLRMLTIDKAIGNQWLVSQGLEPGDRVIVEGVQKVRPGATVKVVPFDSTQSVSGQEPSKMRKDGGA